MRDNHVPIDLGQFNVTGKRSIVMPSIIGKIAETAGIFYGMGSIVIVVFIDMVCILALVRYLKKQNQ